MSLSARTTSDVAHSDVVHADEPKKLNVAEFITSYLAARPGATIGYSFSMLIFPLGVVVIPAILGVILDKLKDREPFHQWRHLLVWVLICFLVLLGGYLLTVYLDAYMKPDLQSFVRRRVFGDIMTAYSHNFRTLQVSSIVSKVLKLPIGVFNVMSDWRATVMPGIVTMIAIIAYFFYLDWKLGLMLLFLTGLIGAIMWVSAYVCMNGMIAADYEHDAIHENLGDVLDNLMHVYLADASKQELERLDVMHAKHLQHMSQALNCANHFTGILKVFLGLVTAAVIFYAWTRYNQNKMQSKDLVSMLFVLMCSRHIIYSTLYIWPQLMFDTGLLYKMESYMNRLITRGATAAHNSGDLPIFDCKEGIVFKDVVFQYPGKDLRALNHASFEIGRDEMVRVSGHIGSGKSTLAQLSLGLYPFEGEIRVCGREVRTLSRTQLAELISYVPQNPRLLDRTVLENLAFGIQRTRAEIQEVMRQFKVDFINLDDKVGKAGSYLSTGQRATIYLLRAVLKNTPIIICDEVTANMDAESEKHVLGLLKEIAHNRTLMFISHSRHIDLPFTKHLVLDHGAVKVA